MWYYSLYHSLSTSKGQLVSQKKQQTYLSKPVALSEDSVRSRAKTCSSSCVESETRIHTGSSIRTTIPVWPSCCPLFTFTWSPGCSSIAGVSKSLQLLLAKISWHAGMVISHQGVHFAARVSSIVLMQSTDCAAQVSSMKESQKMHLGSLSRLEVLLQLPGWQVQLVEAPPGAAGCAQSRRP